MQQRYSRWIKKERKEKLKDDKGRREIDEECKNEKSCWKKIFEKESKIWYNNIRNRRRERLECKNFYKTSY